MDFHVYTLGTRRLLGVLAPDQLRGARGAQEVADARMAALLFAVPAFAGTEDLQARLIGQQLGDRLGQQVLVDNRPGAGTLIGTEAAVKAPADGHTILLVTTTFAINPSLHPKVPYDPLKDFTPLIQTTAIPLIVVASNQFAPNTLQEMIALAKQK